MSPIPCFVSTCSVDLTYNAVTGLQADARLADTGSLGCIDRPDEEDLTDGVFVQVADLVGDATHGIAPALITDEPCEGGYCGQSLRRATDGTLFAAPEGAMAFGVGGDIGAMASINSSGTAAGNIMVVGGTDNDDPSSPGANRWREDTITNPFDCEAWCLFTMNEVHIIGQRPGSATAESFYVQANAQIAAITGDVLSASNQVGAGACDEVADSEVFGAWNNRMDHFGSWSGSGGGVENEMQKASNVHALFRVAGGGTVTVRTQVTVINTLRFNMEDAGLGVGLQHPGAVFMRRDTHPQNP